MAQNAPLTTVVRAFDTVEVLWRLDGAGVTDVATHLGVPKSTAHDYLTTLAETDFVVKEDGRYELSLKLLAVGSRVQYRKRLFHAAKTEVMKLADTTGEAANVTVEERDLAVILYSEESDEGLSLGTYPGLSRSLHSLAAGKAIIAHYPRSRVDEIVRERGLTQVTEETITDRDELDEELDRIRSRGYAVDWDEHIIGMGLVAAPIVHEDTVLGSVTVACPTSTITVDRQREELVEAVRNSAKAIALNYQIGP